MTRFVVRLGARAGIRPGDLVGAIANEAGIPSRDIGGIVIQDGLSFVEVASQHAAKVAVVMKNTSLRGRKAAFELDKGGAPSAAPNPEAAAMARERKVPGAFGKTDAPRVPRSSAPRAPRESAPKAPRASAPKAPRMSTPKAPRVSAPKAPRASAVRAVEAAPAAAPAAAKPAFQKPAFQKAPFKAAGHTPRSFTEKNPAEASRAYQASADNAKAKAERLAAGPRTFSENNSKAPSAFGQKKPFGDKKVFGTPGQKFEPRRFDKPEGERSFSKAGDRPFKKPFGKPAGDKPFFKKKKF